MMRSIVTLALVSTVSAEWADDESLSLLQLRASPKAEGAMDYIGCYVDDGHRDLNQGPKAYGYNSETCKTACSGYTYFALQNGGWCVCDNAYSTAPQYSQRPDGECGAVCSGEAGKDPARYCGAGWRNAVYAVADKAVAAAPKVDNTMDYIGCFVDDGSRDLNQGPKAYGYNSETCKAACSDYTYFALQNGGWCVCDNAYSTAPQYSQRPDGECGAVCSGEDGKDPARYCGAGWRNAVYAVADKADAAAAEGDPHLSYGNTKEDLCCTGEGSNRVCGPCSGVALVHTQQHRRVVP